MYHPTRAVLCGELWMRTEERFHAGFASALSSSDDPQALLAGADSLCLADWPEDTRHRRLRRKLRRLLADLPADADRVNAALIDIPYAVVRRQLLSQRTIPESADAIVEDCARILIASS
jgi:hypothetical protein